MALTDKADTRIKYASNDTTSPDVSASEFIQVFGVEIRETNKKDISYIPIPKSYGDHKEGPTTLALDFLKTEMSFKITGKIYNGKNGRYSLHSNVLNSNDNGEVTDEDMTFTEFGTYHLMGATGIKYDSETFTNDSTNTTLTRGTDYEIDYPRGRIKLLDTADTNVSDSYLIDYTFRGEPYNIAAMIRRMAHLGGNALLETDRTSFTAGSGESGRQYMIQLDTVEIVRTTQFPEEVEVSVEGRVALDRG